MNAKSNVILLLRQAQGILLHRVALHVYFWTLIFLQGLVYAAGTHNPFAFRNIHKAFLTSASYAIPVVINSFLLIEVFFKKRRYSAYFLTLALLLLINSWLSMQVLRQLAGLQIYLIQHVFNTCAFLIMASILRFYRQNVQQQIAFQEMQARQVQAELSLLKSQIHPHFLFNTLNSIYSLALDRSEKAADVVLKLGDLVRYMLHQSQAQSVPLSQEIDYLKNYLWLEKLRLGDRANIQLHTEGNMQQDIAPMLFLPFVENSFKHGVDQLSGQVFVQIQIEANGRELIFQIENNKPVSVLPPTNDLPKTGLANVQRRLSLLYPDRHLLKWEDETGIYRVYLRIDWE